MAERNCMPDEILVEIFTRLPVKSLLKFRSVNKWLYSLITRPTFMAAQMKNSSQNPLLFLRYFTEGTQKEYFSLEHDDDCFVGEFNSFDMPIRCSNSYGGSLIRIVGSCNGVICLSDDPDSCPNPSKIILWNPSIRKRISLPRPELTSNQCELNGFSESSNSDHYCGLMDDFAGGVRAAFGFGYDSVKNDFKVVRISYHEQQCPPCNTVCPPSVHVYSVNSASWRALDASGPRHEICHPDCSQCFVGGFVHWPGWSDSFWKAIVTFNVQDEVFGEIRMPDRVMDRCFWMTTGFKVDRCRDMLALIQMNDGGHRCSVWVMKEYGVVDSWSEVIKLDLPFGYPTPKVFGFRKNEEVLAFVADGALEECRHIVLLFDRNGRVVKVLGMMDGRPSSFYLSSYVESLALFKEGTAIV